MTLEFKYPFIDGYEDLPNDKEDDLKSLKDWMKSQPHLPNLSDEYLYLFLHSNYFKLKETQDTIETYFTMRANSPELFDVRSPSGPVFQATSSIVDFAILKEPTPEGYRVIICRIHDRDISKFNFTHCLNVFLAIIEVSLSEHKLSPGYIFIYDTTSFTFSHFLRLNVSGIRKCMKFLQEALPIRLKGFYTIHAPPFMDSVWALFRPFMNAKIFEVIQVYNNDITGLYKSIPKDILPKDYGGDKGSMKSHHDDLMKLIHSKYEKWLVDKSSPAADMSKHPKLARKSFFSFW